MTIEEHRATAVVSLAHTLLLYTMMWLQLLTREDAKRRVEKCGEKFSHHDTNDLGALFGQRCFLNYIEQAIPFLVTLWLCSLCVSSQLAATLGTIGLVSRIFYPLLWALGPGGTFSPLVEFSTQPWYCCIFGNAGAAVTWILFDFNIMDELQGWQVFVAVLGYCLCGWFLVFGMGGILHLSTKWAFHINEAKSRTD